MQPSNEKERYELSELDRMQLIPPNIKYKNDQLPSAFAAELACMPPESSALKAGMHIDEAIAELEKETRAFLQTTHSEIN